MTDFVYELTDRALYWQIEQVLSVNPSIICIKLDNNSRIMLVKLAINGVVY